MSDSPDQFGRERPRGETPQYGRSPQQPPPGYQPYTQQPYGFSQYPAEHPQGTTILVLGILSLVVCGILGPIAWTMGNSALRDMDSNPRTVYSNRGSVTAGRICGIIGTVFLVLGVLAVVLAVVLAAGAG